MLVDIDKMYPSVRDHVYSVKGIYTYPNTKVVMAGKVVDYLLTVADEQDAFIESVNDIMRVKDNHHWINVNNDGDNVFEFQFQVHTDKQIRVARDISSKLQDFR